MIMIRRKQWIAMRLVIEAPAAFDTQGMRILRMTVVVRVRQQAKWLIRSVVRWSGSTRLHWLA
jgi:hypothetical protein